MYYLPNLMRNWKKKNILQDLYVFNKYYYGYELRFRIELELLNVPAGSTYNIQTLNDQITKDLIMTTRYVSV